MGGLLAFSGPGAGIEITPHAAGHLIGGAIWQIRKDAEEILYALDYNHKKERHLNPATLEALSRPTLLITDAYNAENTQPDRKTRDIEFIESIMSTLRQGGDVFLPVRFLRTKKKKKKKKKTPTSLFCRWILLVVFLS